MTAGRVRGGFNQYGVGVGILLLDTRFPRVPGDIGSAASFDFPVRYHRVAGADSERVVRQGAAGGRLSCGGGHLHGDLGNLRRQAAPLYPGSAPPRSAGAG